MKLFEINKPRMRMSPDGRMVPAPSADTIPWQRPRMPRKRKPKENPMVAQQQAAPAPAPFKHNLSPEAKAKQAETKSNMRANRGGAPLNPSLASSGVKQSNNLTNAKQQVSLSNRLTRPGNDFPEMVRKMAKGNPSQISGLLQVLNKALSQSPGPDPMKAMGYRAGRSMKPKQERNFTRQQADDYLRKRGINVTESDLHEALNKTSLPVGQIYQQALKLNRVDLINLIKDLEDISQEGTKPGQQHTGNYRNNPSLAGVNREDLQPQQPTKRGFGAWLTGRK